MLPMLPSITIHWTQHGIVHCHWCCIKCKEHSGSQVDGCMHKKLHSFSLHCPATRIVWCQWRSKGMLRDLCQPSNTCVQVPLQLGCDANRESPMQKAEDPYCLLSWSLCLSLQTCAWSWSKHAMKDTCDAESIANQMHIIKRMSEQCFQT